jgi:hypothetical protein
MKRDELELLALADHRVALTDIFLHKQGEFIDALHRLGHDTTDAYGLLIEFEQMRARLLADRAQLRRELEQAEPGGTGTGATTTATKTATATRTDALVEARVGIEPA